MKGKTPAWCPGYRNVCVSAVRTCDDVADGDPWLPVTAQHLETALDSRSGEHQNSNLEVGFVHNLCPSHTIPKVGKSFKSGTIWVKHCTAINNLLSQECGVKMLQNLLQWLSGKDACQSKRHKSRSRKWGPAPVSLPGECHGQRSLADYSPRGPTESDTEVTEQAHTCIVRGDA